MMKKILRIAAAVLAIVMLLTAAVSCRSKQEKQEQTVVGTCGGFDVLYEELRYVTLTYKEIAYALEKSLVKLDAALMKVLEEMPPELYSDVVKNGIYLTGGGALIKGLAKRLNAKTNLPFIVAEDPLRAVVRGTGIALKNVNRFSFLMR